MRRYDYKCKLGHVTEQRGTVEDSVKPCLLCGEPARRIPSKDVYLKGETVAKR